MDIVERFLNIGNVFAVVGASNNPEKYGHKVYLDLKKAGYRVFPVNPNAESVCGDKAYKSLGDLPVKPDVVNFVVPPLVTLETVAQCDCLKIDKVWMQPGSESPGAIFYCAINMIEVLYGVCVMIERVQLNEGDDVHEG